MKTLPTSSVAAESVKIGMFVNEILPLPQDGSIVPGCNIPVRYMLGNCVRYNA
jgi:hypothetical protein